MSERLGHLIRRYRIFPPTQTLKTDLLRILDAADLGLYWSIAAPMEIAACEKQTREVIAEREGLREERDELRRLYLEDVKKINAAGFDNLDTLIAGKPRHGPDVLKDFACWLAKVFNDEADLDAADWLDRVETYLNRERTNDLPF